MAITAQDLLNIQKQQMGQVQQPPPGYQFPYMEQPKVSDMLSELQSTVKPGESVTWRESSVPNSTIDANNIQVEFWRKQNEQLYNNAISKVADAVQHNIMAAEKTREMLKGTPYEGESFYGGQITKAIPGSEATPFTGPSFITRSTPDPTIIDTDVKYNPPPKFEFKPITQEARVSKKFPNAPSGPRDPVPEAMINRPSLDASGNAKTFESMPLNKSFGTGTDKNSWNHQVENNAMTQNQRNLSVGKKPLPDYEFQVNDLPSDYVNEWKANSGTTKPLPATVNGNLALEIFTNGYIAKKVKENPNSMYSKFWNSTGNYIDEVSGLNLRRVTPLAATETSKSSIVGRKDQVQLPKMVIRTQGGLVDIADSRRDALYTQWTKSSGKTDPESFAAAVRNGEVKDVVYDAVGLPDKENPVSADVKYNQNHYNIILEAATEFYNKFAKNKGLAFDRTTYRNDSPQRYDSVMLDQIAWTMWNLLLNAQIYKGANASTSADSQQSKSNKRKP